jgi:hypothetical protein
MKPDEHNPNFPTSSNPIIMQKRLKSTLLAAASLSSIFLVSCAGNMNTAALVARNATASHHTGQPVSTLVSGGSFSSSVLANVSNEEFKQALECSLVQSGLFKSTGSGGYQVAASIISIKQPMIGISMTVSMQVSYEVKRGNSVIWSRVIQSTYKAPASEALIGAVRVRKATEGAVRENIANFVRALDEKSL